MNPRRIVFVILDGFQPLDLAGPREVFPLAGHAALSRRHLRRRFAAEVGTSAGAYVELVRIEAARRALTEGDDPVETIARRCGFGTAETLRRAFHRHPRVAPSDYRSRFRSARIP